MTNIKHRVNYNTPKLLLRDRKTYLLGLSMLYLTNKKPPKRFLYLL
nr:MAG TPA: hypothetical protein [Caudoviricetes sp.]